MNNNDILKRLRYTFDWNDDKVISLFAHGNMDVTRTQISDWLKKEDDVDFDKLNDKKLASFLNGFIINQRGKRDGPPPIPEKTLTNNIIFRKLRIALNLKDEDILQMLENAGLPISKHELSAFFRKPEQRQYRLCKDQILRNFLYGMQLHYRGKK